MKAVASCKLRMAIGDRNGIATYRLFGCVKDCLDRCENRLTKFSSVLVNCIPGFDAFLAVDSLCLVDARKGLVSRNSNL
jgi:hypothetical protein